MKISRATLQNYFASELPDIAGLNDAFTFHSFEIDSIEGDTLDVKVLPNRAADCKTEEGIARELSAILDLPLKAPPTPDYTKLPAVATSLARVNGILGASFTLEQVQDACRRLNFKIDVAGDTLTVTPPAERVDIVILEDVAEEVGRIIGYDKLAPAELPPLAASPDQARYRGIERIKDVLSEHGYTEISTQSFAALGEVMLSNPLDTTRPFLRVGLTQNMREALARGAAVAPRVLGPDPMLKLFEIGTTFTHDKEHLSLVLGYRQLAGKESDAVLADALDALAELLGTLPEGALPRPGGTVEINLTSAPLETIGKDYIPRAVTLGSYKPFSLYPFALRDVAVWTPLGTEQSQVEEIIFREAGELLARIDLFDRFEKDGRLSLGFRLVFEAFDRTLTDVELNEAMTRVTAALNSQTGYEVR
jgi:phenylalanyl-tRNA synthetase beta chain